MKKFVLLFFFLALLFSPTPALADECNNANTTLNVDDAAGILTITVPGKSFLSNTNYQLYYLQDEGPNSWFSWGKPTQSTDSNNDGLVDTLVFEIPFSEIAKNRSFYDNGYNAGVNFRISEGTNSYTNFFCGVTKSLSSKDADKIYNYLQSANLVPITNASAPTTGVGVTAPPPATCTPESGFGDADTGVPTGLGCIPTQPDNLVRWILKYAILMGGGIAFLLSVWGGITILLAAGNPEKINEGKEIIGSAITGLMFIILSVFLLRLIGFDILQLPDFTP